jgi:phage tail sheath protein FI
MSTLTLASPGVQINEVDLSIIARPSGATNVFITGFANQGPTDELINVGSISEFESIFGTPTNASERYLYNSARQLLTQSPANLLVTRMPYGSGVGAGFSNQYTALVYPLSSDGATYEKSSNFKVLAPYSVLLTDDQYLSIVENNVTWSQSYVSGAIQTFADIQAKGGIVVLDEAKTSVSGGYQGYYVGLADNSNNNPATDFNAITGIKAANTIVNGVYQTFTSVPSTRLNFSLTQAFSAAGTSVSQTIEQYPTQYDFGLPVYNDCLTLMLYKVRTSIYNQDTVVLDAIVSEGYTGSLYANRTQNNQKGGAPVSFFLDNITNQVSSNIKVVTNPYVTNTGTWTNPDGTPAKTVRVANEAKNLYSEGVYISDTDTVANDVGNVPQKLQRILNNVDTLDQDLDLTVEAGLGTIWASAKARQADTNYGNGSGAYIFDENYNVDISVLKTQTNNPVGGIASDYQDVANQFVAFADSTRKDHVFIADALRNIFVQGQNTKASDASSYVFSSDVYWPVKNLFASIESSYVASYGNWIKINDTTSNKQIWAPASAWVATVIAKASQNVAPWSAPAGFNRASLTNVSDVAINPTQKQRDLLYKINVNPIAFFPGDGYVIFGQKTQYKKPSAFDRINVRRLFLSLEKTTKNVLKYFLFEPNTFVTRTRIVNALKPSFDQALNSDGLYAYKIVCDERNNTPATIDNNQLNIAIYIQPVRTAEFILCDFIATQTGVNFNELIG